MSKMKLELNETKTNLKMVWKYVRNKKKTLFIMIVLSIILSVIGVIVPILSAKEMVNLSGGFLKELLYVVLLMFFVEVIRNFVNYLLRLITAKYMIKTVSEMQMDMFEETLKIKVSEIDKNTSGTFIDRISDDTTDIVNIFSDIAGEFIDLISNIGILAAIFIINKWMLIYFALAAIVKLYVKKKRRDIYFKQDKKYRSIRERRTGLISEIVRGIRDIKLLSANVGILNKIKKQLADVNKDKLDMEKTDIKYFLYIGDINELLTVLFFVLGIIMVNNATLSITNFMVIYMYRWKVENLLDSYNRFVEHIKRFNISATRVFEILGNKFAKEIDNGIELDINGNIEFKNVTFSYGNEDVLKDINFKINKGERIGFVGESGSGKSTILNLITRLYDLKNGSILIDNVNINDISIDSLRSSISLIPQSPYIFNFSVLDNIKITNDFASKKEVIEACKKANIYEKIMELPDTFDTIVGESGVILSGGEKQRLAIARSLLKKSNIMLFDESTSSLDNITQNKIQESIYGLDKDKTILIVAHRLSTILKCDKIIVIDDGKILDIGTHLELLKRCDKYKELYKFENKLNN